MRMACSAPAEDNARQRGPLSRPGPVHASNLGGWVARTVGPRFLVSRVAGQNLRRALPELTAAERCTVIRAMWDNLGRTMAELPRLPALFRPGEGPGWEIEGEEHGAH